MKKQEIIVWVVLGVVVLASIGYFGWKASAAKGVTQEFAQCLTDKGFKMYGAFWCPHCISQKELFGKNVGYINYIECSTSDGRSQLQVCADAGITGYPTWVFGDGTKVEGEVTLQRLSDASGCVLG